jgi:putative hemolysin
MKYLLSLLFMISIVSCTTTEAETQAQPKIGMPNPASKYCVEQGGKSIIKKDEQGNSYGVCRLKNGNEVDEWKYFRENNKN